MQTKTIRQSITFHASPHQVYEAPMDSRQHSRFTGAKASISRQVGGKFTAYDGDLEGINVELVPDKKIVRTWRSSDWPKGHYSRVSFSLKGNDRTTQLTFTHLRVPEQFYKDIKQGWHDFYWTPMKAMLSN